MIVVNRFFLLQIIFCFVVITCKAQEINKLIVEESGKEILLGKIDKKALQNYSFANWFIPNFNTYKVDTTYLKKISRKLKKYNIQVFLGTWCGDSRREVPRFFKILDAIDFPENQLEMLALNHTREQYKKSPTGEEKGLHIIKVPTFIFYKNGKEVNRIVESPVKILEEDILRILNGEYTPNYSVD